MSLSFRARPFFIHAFLLFLVFLVIHLAWEEHNGMGFPDHHTPNFLGFAIQSGKWIEGQDHQGRLLPGFAERGPDQIFPNTGDYPPLLFLMSGAAMSVFGEDRTVARLPQLVFVLGLILAMARLGWQVAGTRGAVLLALGAATASWTGHYTRVYCLALGQMFVLAVILTWILDSERLTHPRVCAMIGLVFGLGMLVKYSVLILILPVLLVSALPRLLRSRISIPALLLLLGETVLIVQMTRALILQTRAPELAPFELGEWSWILLAEGLFLLTAICAWDLGRRGLRSPGAGLLMVASVCGMVCSPWYFVQGELWAWFIDFQSGYTPAMTGQLLSLESLRGSLAAAWRVLETFYWEARWLLGLGPVALALWGWRSPRVRFLLVASLAILLTQVLLLHPSKRYFASMLPALVVLAFLWAARWRWSFVACTLFLSVAGTLQLAGWLDPVGQAARMAGLKLTPVSDFPLASVQPIQTFLTPIPIAEPPAQTLDFLEAITPGSTVGHLKAICKSEPQPSRFFEIWLSTRARVYELTPSDHLPFSSLDYLVLTSWRKLSKEQSHPFGLKTSPDLYKIEISTRTLYLYVHRLQDAPKPRAPVHGTPTGPLEAPVAH